MGAISAALFSNSISVFGNGNGWGGSADYTINSAMGQLLEARTQLLLAGTLGTASFEDAKTGLTGAALSMAIGHLLGAYFSGSLPEWRTDAWVYKGLHDRQHNNWRSRALKEYQAAGTFVTRTHW
jgi:hypothetical protein